MKKKQASRVNIGLSELEEKFKKTTALRHTKKENMGVHERSCYDSIRISLCLGSVQEKSLQKGNKND